MDVDRGDRLPAVDERLEDMRHAGVLEPLGPAPRQLVVNFEEGSSPGGREHRHADELPVRLIGRDLGTDPQDPAAALGRHEATPVRRRLRDHQVEGASGGCKPGAVGVVERPIDHHGDVCPAGEKARQDRRLEDDVAVEEEERPAERLPGAQQ